MNSSDISPLSVVDYDKDFLVALIRYFTGSAQRSEISIKPQLNYLCEYLEADHIATKTIVVENEYVDRHYLEDYSEYYARCFTSHPRKCVRVHFFSHSFSENEFTSAIVNNQASFISELQSKYIGFAVIRPIPHTFLAKLCLKPYDRLIGGNGYKVIRRANRVSLFGIPLNIETTAFLEQDKVVSACATSALWTLLGASSFIHQETLPSPSSITKSASNSSFEGTRTFPNTGLTHAQVARSLKHYGLEPSILGIQSSTFSDLKEIIYAYVSNDIPVLIGGDIYKLTDDDNPLPLGKHLVCAVGYHLGKKSTKKNSQKFLCDEIDKIYAHDDRYGPYVRIATTSKPFCFIEEGKSMKKYGLEVSLHNKRNELFTPEIAVLGLYHKIRIPYKTVKETCQALFEYLRASQNFLGSKISDIKNFKNGEEKEYFSDIYDAITLGISSVWDIRLITNTKIKEDLLQNTSFLAFNGSFNKASLFVQSMPRYLWRCRLLIADTRNELCDIYFDATEVPQGNVLIGYVSYALEAEAMWKHIENQVKQHIWDSFPIEENLKQYVGMFSKFFSEKEKSLLSTLYGSLGLPRRKLKNGELDHQENFPLRADVMIIRSGVFNWGKLNPDIKYIWVINEFGDLVLGEDVQHDNEFLGHPTLVDGKPARLGGELYFQKLNATWVVNLRSRAYSGHLSLGSIESDTYLQNVIEHNFSGLKPINKL